MLKELNEKKLKGLGLRKKDRERKKTRAQRVCPRTILAFVRRRTDSTFTG